MGKAVRIAILSLASGLPLLGQAPGAAGPDVPAVIEFVAPAYPRAARDQRIQGTTFAHIAIRRDGFVKEAKTISAHPVFEHYVLEALKQWRFRASDREHAVQVTCTFEFMDDKCEGTDKHPITSETYISAELPTVVHIKTGLQCIEVSSTTE